MEDKDVKNKILISISGVGSKKLVMSSIVNLGYDFIEFQDQEDLRFKLNLFKNNILLMIYELNYTAYNQDFDMIRNITNQGIKTLLIIDRYEAKVIDDALEAGANDIIILPLKDEVLKNKIKTILSSVSKPLEYIEIKEVAYVDPSIIEYEIIRADRGKYSISLVMAEFYGLNEEEIQKVSEKIKKKLRETDLIMKYGNNKLLLVCPFTGKENIVEIENKVRLVVQEYISQSSIKSSVIVYGKSYPKDGESANMLIELLEEGIANSRMIGRIRGTFHDINKDDIEIYRKIFGKSKTKHL